MSVSYRCVIGNDSNEVIAIGYDEKQGGKDYNGIGVWADFVFKTIPEPLEEALLKAEEIGYTGSLLKVVEGEVVSKIADEIVEPVIVEEIVEDEIVEEEIIEE